MKCTGTFLIFLILITPFQPALVKSETKYIVTLTAEGIDSADVIEAAIIEATASGSRPGTVILDVQDGAFLLAGADHSLNIFVSDLTLRGVNEAVIENCDDGLFFDGFPLKNILVEGISFLCTGDGVEATGAFQDVNLRENAF